MPIWRNTYKLSDHKENLENMVIYRQNPLFKFRQEKITFPYFKKKYLTALRIHFD